MLARTGETMFRTIVVDDQPIFRDILRGVLTRTGHFQFVGEAQDGAEALDLYNRVRPDVVIMDVQMPGMSGFATTVRIIEEHPDATVILTSMSGDPSYAGVATEAGARGFLPKRNFDPQMVLGLLLDSQGDAGQQLAA